MPTRRAFYFCLKARDSPLRWELVHVIAVTRRSQGWCVLIRRCSEVSCTSLEDISATSGEKGRDPPTKTKSRFESLLIISIALSSSRGCCSHWADEHSLHHGRVPVLAALPLLLISATFNYSCFDASLTRPKKKQTPNKIIEACSQGKFSSNPFKKKKNIDHRHDLSALNAPIPQPQRPIVNTNDIKHHLGITWSHGEHCTATLRPAGRLKESAVLSGFLS